MITPIPRKPHTDADAAEDNAEARMRQTLGKLGTAKLGKSEPLRRTTYQAKPKAGRHRFRQDGEVPVVRISLTEGSRSGEHHPRAPAEVAQAGAGQGHRADIRAQDGGGDMSRQVQVLTEQLQTTRTRLGRAELALGEAEKAALERQEEAISLRHALDAAEATLAQVRVQMAASEQAREGLERRREATRPSRTKSDEQHDITASRKVGRPLGSTTRVPGQGPAGEPEPVRWWAGD